DPTSWISARLNGKGKSDGYRGSRPLQDDSRSVSRAAGRLAEAANRGEFTFGPRPPVVPIREQGGLLPGQSEDHVRLLSQGRDARRGDVCGGRGGDPQRIPEEHH